MTASSDAQLSMLDARGFIHGPRRGPGHAPGHRQRAPAGPTGGPQAGAVSRRLGAFATAALCVDLDGVRLVAGGEGPSHVLKVWDFSQVRRAPAALRNDCVWVPRTFRRLEQTRPCPAVAWCCYLSVAKGSADEVKNVHGH